MQCSSEEFQLSLNQITTEQIHSSPYRCYYSFKTLILENFKQYICVLTDVFNKACFLPQQLPIGRPSMSTDCRPGNSPCTIFSNQFAPSSTAGNNARRPPVVEVARPGPFGIIAAIRTRTEERFHGGFRTARFGIQFVVLCPCATSRQRCRPVVAIDSA